MLRTSGLCRAVTIAFSLLVGSGAVAADDGVWSVSKSSGEVWITATGAQPASLKQDDALRPGDTIRTGRTGRVLLVRGEETILIAPNSVIGVPTEKKDGLSTTIQQQAGSILLEVEKRNVKHFEVETPYLAAVVKGTQFSVTIDGASTRVAVNRGQVEVVDFKSGQIAQVLPGQAATSLIRGKPGLSLSGSGTFAPIEQGKPRAPSIDRIQVPKGGLQAPRNAGEGKTIHAVAPAGSTGRQARVDAKTMSGRPVASLVTREARTDGGKRGVVRISSALGEVKVNVNKATHGLAHGSSAPGGGRSASRDSSRQTIWSDSKASVSTAYANTSSSSGNAAAAGGSSAAAAVTSPAAAAAVAAASGSSSDPGSSGNNGNGKGNKGNGNGNKGNGNGNGATGNGKSAGNGNKGNNGNGNGNGNGGVGNGNGKGNAKH